MTQKIIVDEDRCYVEDECLAVEITIGDEDIEALKMAIKALEQEPILDKYQAEIDHLHMYIGRLETQITEDSFINKPCVSEKVCEHDKQKVLDKIRAEIEKEIIPRNSDQYDHEAMWQNMGLRMALKVIDKYKEEVRAK